MWPATWPCRLQDKNPRPGPGSLYFGKFLLYITICMLIFKTCSVAVKAVYIENVGWDWTI